MTDWLRAKLGRMRVSTLVLIVAFIALFWVHQTCIRPNLAFKPGLHFFCSTGPWVSSSAPPAVAGLTLIRLLRRQGEIG